jgi:hypothetical protein
MKFDWLNIAVGVVCFVVVGLLVGWLSSMIPLALPGFIWTAITALIAILVWFSIMPRIKR